MRRVLIFFDKGLRGWIRTKVRRERWRLPRWMDNDDLFNEGVVVYCKCVNNYQIVGPTPYDDKCRFMAYFKAAFSNRLTDLANERTATPEVNESGLTGSDEDAWQNWYDTASNPPEALDMAHFATAPESMLSDVEAVMEAEQEPFRRHRLLTKKKLSGGGIRFIITNCRVRETTNEHYKRVLGESEVPKRVRRFLLEA